MAATVKKLQKHKNLKVLIFFLTQTLQQLNNLSSTKKRKKKKKVKNKT